MPKCNEPIGMVKKNGRNPVSTGNIKVTSHQLLDQHILQVWPLFCPFPFKTQETSHRDSPSKMQRWTNGRCWSALFFSCEDFCSLYRSTGYVLQCRLSYATNNIEAGLVKEKTYELHRYKYQVYTANSNRYAIQLVQYLCELRIKWDRITLQCGRDCCDFGF